MHQVVAELDEHIFIHGHWNKSPLRTGYMIISVVKNGRMLSDSWAERLFTDKIPRQTLFSGLAGIMQRLNKVPLPWIGSLTLDGWWSNSIKGPALDIATANIGE